MVEYSIVGSELWEVFRCFLKHDFEDDAISGKS
jgi:hypothetical protein